MISVSSRELETADGGLEPPFSGSEPAFLPLEESAWGDRRDSNPHSSEPQSDAFADYATATAGATGFEPVLQESKSCALTVTPYA